MKRLIIAGLLLIIVAAIYITSFKYITYSCEKSQKLLESSVEIYETGKSAKNAVTVLEKYWNTREKFLSFFVNHDNIDKLEENIALLKLYSSENNIFFRQYAENIKVLLHQITEETKFSAHSIF